MLPTNVLHNNTPYEMFKKKSDYHFLRVFGCVCYLLLRPYNPQKFYFKSSVCLFQGYPSQHKGYICLSSSGKTYISRHVTFNENIIPYTIPNNHSTSISSSNELVSAPNYPLTVIHPACSDTPNQNSVNNDQIKVLLCLKLLLLLLLLHLQLK